MYSGGADAWWHMYYSNTNIPCCEESHHAYFSTATPHITSPFPSARRFEITEQTNGRIGKGKPPPSHHSNFSVEMVIIDSVTAPDETLNNSNGHPRQLSPAVTTPPPSTGRVTHFNRIFNKVFLERLKLCWNRRRRTFHWLQSHRMRNEENEARDHERRI